MPTSSDQNGAYVLVVDDEPTIGEIMARYLQRAAFRRGSRFDRARSRRDEHETLAGPCHP